MTNPPQRHAAFTSATSARSVAGDRGAVDRWRQAAGQLREHFPALVRETLAEADAARRGQLVLPGTAGVPAFLGEPVRWLHNPTHDPEFTWKLHRLEHWKVLLRADLFEERAGYGQRVDEELRGWIRDCPRPPMDVSRGAEVFNATPGSQTLRRVARIIERFPLLLRPSQDIRYRVREWSRRRRRGARATTPARPRDAWRLMEAGHRMFGAWPLVRRRLALREPRDLELERLLRASAREHGEILAEISPCVWPGADHNHYLQECLGLLSVATEFPDFEASPRWAAQGVREIERCAAVQLTGDGGHIEGCPHYHNWCVYFFCRAMLIADAHDLCFSDEFRQRVRAALPYAAQSMRPTGVSVPWGDSDADQIGIKATLLGYVCFGEVAPIRVAMSIAGEEAVARQCWEELWHIPDVANLLQELRAAPASVADAVPRVSHQRQLKQALFRTGWDRMALSVFFACRTPVHNAHAHVDPMSFDLTAFGETLVADPGRFSYQDNAVRRDFKSASWHSTLTVADREPFAYVSSWRFGPQKFGDVTAVYETDGVLAAEAVHEAYAPAIHRRLLAVIDSAVVLVLDDVSGLSPTTRVQIYYHLNSTDVTWNAARSAADARCGRVHLSVLVTPNLAGMVLPGRISPSLDVAVDSRRLRLEDGGGLARRCYGTLFVATPDDCPSIDVGDFHVNVQDGDVVCRITTAGSQRVFRWHSGPGGFVSSQRGSPISDVAK